MPEWLNHSQYLVALVTGLLGGAHCFGMCGSIVGALSLNNIKKSPSSHTPLSLILAYNTGRISAYVTVGAFVAFSGTTLIKLTGLQQLQESLAIIAALFMVALGLYLSGIWNGISKLEIVGTYSWKLIQPISQRFIPIRNTKQAVIAGFLWGWLPCGLVYTVLIWTLSAKSTLDGALIMLAFGLGTLPNLLVMGVTAARLARWIKHPYVRITSGLLVVLMGLLSLQRAFFFNQLG